MTDFLGMSTEQAQSVAQSLSGYVNQLRGAQSSAASVAGGMQWVGDDREDFMSHWGGASGALEQLAQALNQKATALSEHAEQQNRASAGTGGASGMSGVSGTPSPNLSPSPGRSMQ